MASAPESVRDALKVILYETRQMLPGTFGQTPELRTVSDYIVTHEWADWIELIDSFPFPGRALLRLLAGPEEQARDAGMMRWLASTLDRWMPSPSYRHLLEELPLRELRDLLGAREQKQLETLASSSPYVLAYIALALSDEPAGLTLLSRRTGRGDPDVLADHMAETSRLARHAATLQLTEEERLGWQRALVELTHRCSPFDDNKETEDSLGTLLGDETAHEIVSGLDGREITMLAKQSGALFRALATKNPRGLTLRFSLPWTVSLTARIPRCMWDTELRIVADRAPMVLCPYLAPFLAHDLVLQSPGMDARAWGDRWLADRSPTLDQVSRELWQLVQLWAGATEVGARSGHEHRLSELAAKQAQLWARSLPALLAESRWQPLVVPLTIAIEAREPDIRQYLRELADLGNSDVSARARSLLRLIEGTESPTEAGLQALVSFVARRADERTVFPHPLAFPSSTWVGSREVEEVLRKLVVNACNEFSRRVIGELGLDEEPITYGLLRDLEHALAGFTGSPWIMRDLSRSAAPRIEIKCRQESKHAENLTGVDFALLVEIDVPDAIQLTTGELVQVKKPERHGQAFVDKWRVKIPQLRNLLAASPTTAYVLIGPRGDLHVVPAKFLLGVLQGCGQAGQESGTVSYAQVRGATISFAQLLIDLILGLWVGGTERVVAIARGVDRALVPKRVLAIQVRAAREGNLRS